jgi:hypothetical protein
VKRSCEQRPTLLLSWLVARKGMGTRGTGVSSGDPQAGLVSPESWYAATSPVRFHGVGGTRQSLLATGLGAYLLLSTHVAVLYVSVPFRVVLDCSYVKGPSNRSGVLAFPFPTAVRHECRHGPCGAPEVQIRGPWVFRAAGGFHSDPGRYLLFSLPVHLDLRRCTT